MRTSWRLVSWLAATAMVAAVSACGSSGNEPSGATNTVNTEFGEVTIPAKPKRVVALGWGDAETALALGFQPVGASDWLEFGGDGVGPWAKGRYDTAPKQLGTLEPDLEAIAALKPDLILDTKSDGTQERYDVLSKIAPTVGVPPGGKQYDTSWRQQVTLVSAALGVPDKGRRLIASTQAQFTDTLEKYPEFRRRTVTVGALSGQGYGAYVARDSRMQFLTSLGFKASRKVEKLAGASFSVPLSRENLDVLNADLTIVIPIGVPASDIRDDKILARVPSVRAGRLLVFSSRDVQKAFSTNTVLSLRFALENVPPLLAEKIAP